MSATGVALRYLKDLQHIKLDNLRFRIIDARGQVVGRLASEISIILQGKDKPSYNPKKNEGDVVIVVNAAHVHFTHDKWETKLYRHHTGFPGGLRAVTAKDQWEKDPTSIITKAVRGMLPKNKTRLHRLDKLKVFPEAEHPFNDFDLVPFVPAPRQLRDQGLGWSMPRGFEPVNPDQYGFRVMTMGQGARGQARPDVDIGDLLTAEERAQLEKVKA